ETRQFGSAQGGEAFFEKARAIGFGDPEVAEVILCCVALGFGGKYRANPGQLRVIQQEIAPRAGVDARALEGRLCPAAYESVADRDFTKLPVARAARIAALLAVLVVGLLAVGYALHEYKVNVELKQLAR
ncbi:MAG TPA: DotU family type IV/VI secretion system protein, partial [Planctomycetota bacterium]|nr:DotU family type IV/VI secretion system protein [Planctomycetota bacterium]